MRYRIDATVVAANTNMPMIPSIIDKMSSIPAIIYIDSPNTLFMLKQDIIIPIKPMKRNITPTNINPRATRTPRSIEIILIWPLQDYVLNIALRYGITTEIVAR